MANKNDNKKDKNKKKKKTQRGRRRGKKRRNKREFEQNIIDLSRVTRVTSGGKRMSFRTALVIGNKKGKVGFGLAKSTDIATSIEKANRQAKKNIIEIPMVDETIPHAVRKKFGAAEILLKPAPQGTGLKSGGAIREVLELGGVPNAVSKILNSNNKINIAKATLAALDSLRLPEDVPVSPAPTVDTEEESATA